MIPASLECIPFWHQSPRVFKDAQAVLFEADAGSAVTEGGVEISWKEIRQILGESHGEDCKGAPHCLHPLIRGSFHVTVH